MDRNNVLKFQVAIEDKASDGLKEIESRLNGIVEKFKSSVGGINAELGKIGQSVQMPNMAEAIRQTEKLKDSLKKNTDDIPLFKNVLEQMQQLQNFIGKNTLGGELDRMKKSLSSVFAEIPKVDNNSFTVYFNQLNKAYSEFMAKFGTQRTRTPNLLSIGESMQKMGGLAGGDTLLREYQAQAEQIKATIINTVRETNEVISATRFLIKDSAKDFGKIDSNINKVADSLTRLSEAFTRFNGTVGGDQNLKNIMAGMGEIIRNVKFSMSSLKEGQENLNWGKTMADNAKSVIQARVEMERLVPLVEKLKTQQLLSKGLGLDTSNIDVTIQRVQHLQQLLMSITAHGGFTSTGVENLNGLNASQLMSAYKEHLVKARNDLASQSQANAQALKSEAQAQKENALAKSHAAQANQQLSSEEGRLAQAIQQATNSAHGQSQVISDLKSMALQYLSVWGAQNFITQIAQVTGELQLQARSLEVILNNASAAKQMYGEIRDLSQMSPYTFEDLLKSHRQLAAFGIEPKNMFSTMKSLADIGAGLDVEISRLILAYGHTRSYGYLSGIQNRQFENAGIDMIGGLADKYNKLADAEKRAGREAEYVSRADIFKKMRSRSIPFEDVESVIMDLDKPGGKFYNMQIRQFDTLGGKLRNLRNNYRIMMSEIGNSNQGMLMGTVAMINDLTENWERYARVLKGIGVAYGAMKLVGLASVKEVMAANKELVSSSVAASKAMGTTAYLNGSMSMWGAMGSSRQWLGRKWKGVKLFGGDIASSNNDNAVRSIATNEKISNLTKQRIALSGKLTKEQRKLMLVESGVNKVRAAQIAGFSAWKRGLLSVRLAMIAVAQSAKAMAVALLTNPMTWVFAAIAAITALADKLGETSEQAESLKNSIKDAAQTDIEGLNQLLEPYEKNGVIEVKGYESKSESGYTANKKIIDVNEVELEAHGVETVFDELNRALQVQSPFYDGDYFDIMKAENQAAQVGEIINKLEDISYVKQVEQMTADRIETGYNETGAGPWYKFWTWGRAESLGTNMKDYAASLASFSNEFNISETSWNEIAEEDKTKIEEYIKELGISRNEAIRKYFRDNPSREAVAPMEIKRHFASDEASSTGVVAQHNTVKADMEPMGKTFASIFKENFARDMDGAMTYFEDTMNKMYSENGVGSPEAQAKLSEDMATTVYEAMKNMGDKIPAEEFLQKFWERQVGVFANKKINQEITADTPEQDIDKKVSESINATISAMQKSSKEFSDWWKAMGKDAREKFIKELSKSGKGVANFLRKTLAWQGRAKRFGISVSPDIDIDYTEFIESKRKLIKDTEEKLKANQKRMKFILGVDVLPDFNFKNTESVKAFLRLISAQKKIKSKQISDFIKSHRDKSGLVHGADWNTLSDMRGELDSLKEYGDFANTILKNGSFLDSEHQSWKSGGDKSGGNYNRRNNGRSNKEDKFAKDIRSQARLLGDAYREYKKWEKEISNDRALEKVQRLFFGKNSALTKAGFSFKDIPNYYKNLESLKKKLESHYNTKGGKNSYVLDAIKELSKSMSEVEFDNFSKDSEKWASKTSLWLDRLTKKWDMYNKVLKETGDKHLAVSLSGFNAEKYQNVADAAREKIAADLKEAGVKSSYDFNVDASDTEIEDSVRAMFGKDTSEEKIKSIVGELKKWRELQKQINDESVETYSNLIGGISRFADAVRKANSEHEKTIESLRKALEIGKITKVQYEQAEAIATAKRDIKTNEASYGYRNLMRGSVSIPAKEIKTNADMAIRRLDDALGSGAITADEYADKITKIDDALRKITDKKNISAFSVFLKGGWQGVLDRRREEEVDRLSVYTQEAEQAVKKRDEAKLVLEKSPNDAALQFAYERARMDVDAAVDKVRRQNKKVQENDKHSAAYKKLSKTVNEAVEALGKFSQALDFLGDFFDSLGMAGAANAVADVQTMANGALRGASSLSFLGPEGMIAGGALGLIGGIFQARDNGIERRIEALRGEVSKIEGYTELIARGRERTLGYDRGEVLRAYQRQYAANMSQIRLMGMVFSINKEGAAGKAMSDYYSSAGGKDTNGYQQELSLLTQKRKDYIDMYNEENKKKKKSKESMEEYKKKIAELDDQIAHFSEDLAKNLWGIDLKSWADQIGDALANAFENGENAANAYKNAVNNIMRSVVNQVLKIGIIQPMMEKLQHKLFGYTDEKGNYHAGIVNKNDPHAFDNPNEIAAKMLSYTADFMSDKGEGKNFMVAVTEFLNGYEKMLNDAGFSIKNNNSKTLSSGIQGTTEETSDLLAGYINALRQDVSYIRLMQTQFINEAWPDYMKQITGMATALGNINSNVAAIRSIISENGALYQKVEMLSDDLHNVIFGSQRLHIA